MIYSRIQKELFKISNKLLLFFVVVSWLGSAESTGLGNANEESSLGGNFNLRLLVNQTQARCMDGTPSGYWFRDGNVENRDKFLLVFVGAGWCRDTTECLARATGDAGSSKSWYQTVTGYGITSADPTENPDFHSFSVAWVGYCDGAFFMGNLEKPLDNGLYFQGQAIVDAVVADLVQQNRLSSAHSVIVTGESSGGLAAALSVDRIRALLPEVNDIRAIVDAGYFLDLENSGGDRNSLEEIRVLSNMTINSDCMGHYAQKEEEQLWHCVSMPYVHRFIQTPLLIVQSAFDYSQLGAYGMDLNCTPPGTTAMTQYNSPLKECDEERMQRFQAFGVKMVEELSSLSTNNSHFSVFVLGCIAHGLTQYGLYQVDNNNSRSQFLRYNSSDTNERSLKMQRSLVFNNSVGHRIPLFYNSQVEVPAASGRTVSRAVSNWYSDRNSDSHLDSNPWPSNKGCAWMGMPY